jgi:hypothetical protein
VLYAAEAQLEHAQLAQFGFDDISLMDGEHVESSLELADDSDDSAEPEVILLTDRRVIHLGGNSNRRKAAFASLSDIAIVDVTTQREGIGAFIWAGLAVFVAFMLWQVIEHPLGSAAAGIIVALMGVYLIVDHIMTPGRPVVTFKVGSAEFRANLKGERASSDIYAFINRLFQLKDENGLGSYSRSKHFAPR